ncbi:MAG: helix-turn-helix domain-containing protein [Candidatus Limnocylindria bacterium]
MDDMRIGRALRALRHRLGWRQVDVGAVAGVSQDLVSLLERGRIETVQVRTLRKIAAAVGAEMVISVRWRGGELDRLLDEGHAAISGAVVRLLERHGWEVRPEVSFAVYSERGSIDLLAWHAPTRTLLVIEVKSELTSAEETLRRLDVKARLAADIARERFGWDGARVVRALVLPDASTPRRRVARHDALFRARFPLRGMVARAWLARPDGVTPRGLLLFQSLTTGDRGSGRPVSRRRIRRAALVADHARDRLREPVIGVPIRSTTTGSRTGG